MAEARKRFSVGNIMGGVLVMVFSGALAIHALNNDSTDRIGRNSGFTVGLGVVGLLVGAWVVIAGIRSRRR